MEQLAGASLARQRFLGLTFGVFAAFALLLASTGISGVLAYLAAGRLCSSRQRECSPPSHRPWP